MDTLISNVTVVTMNERNDVLFGTNVGIDGGKICCIGKSAPETAPATIVDGTGMVMIPGLINCHTHLATAVLRSYCDDLPRNEALETQLKREDKMNSRAAKAAASLAIAECLRFGVTSVSDLYYYPGAVAEAAASAGIKANIALSAYRFIDQNEEFDFETDEQCTELRRVVEKWNGHDDGRIRVDGGIYAEYTSNYKLWEGLVGYCTEQDLGMQLHLSQTGEEVESCLDRTGLAPAELLDCHGVFNVPATVSGCGALTNEEMKVLGRKKVSAVSCPIAAAKCGAPRLSVMDSVRSGMNVALGTGGAIESGNLDMFEVIRAAVLSAKAEGETLPAQAALMMATVCGARAQGRAENTGMIKEGFDADLVLVDFTAPHLMPCHNVLNGLAYSAKGGDVAMTMVRGRILYRNGSFPTIDLKEVVEELTTYAIPTVFAEEK